MNKTKDKVFLTLLITICAMLLITGLLVMQAKETEASAETVTSTDEFFVADYEETVLATIKKGFGMEPEKSIIGY